MARIKLVWFPQWFCQNYTLGSSYGSKCPYCPYSFDRASNRLIFDGVLSGSNRLAPAESVLRFFRENADVIGRFLEISGGEPLLYPHLDRVLGADGVSHGWQWAITSNTLNTAMIEKVIRSSGGRIDGCISWTASYHPFSGEDEAFARNVRLVRAHCGNYLNATVVVSERTMGRLKGAHDFLSSLPFNTVQLHLDAHGTADTESLRQRAADLIGPVPAYAGAPPQGIVCNKNAALIAVGPDGTLYECVTKAYQNLDPLGTVDSVPRLTDLPERIEYCDVACFACCDRVKHAEHVGVRVQVVPRVTC